MARLVYSNAAGRYRLRREYLFDCGLTFRVFSDLYSPDDPSSKAGGFLFNGEKYLANAQDLLKDRKIFDSSVEWLSEYDEKQEIDCLWAMFPQVDLETVLETVESFLNELVNSGELERLLNSG